MRRLLAQVEETLEDQTRTEVFNGQIISTIQDYLNGQQFAHISYSLATIAIAANAGRKTDNAILAVKTEFYTSLSAAVGPTIAHAIEEPIFAATMHSVAVETAKLGDTSGKLSHQAKAEAVKVISSIAAASARNTELLRKYERYADFAAFQNELRAQIQSLHGSMKLPHAGTTKQVSYDKLFVSPKLKFSKLAASSRESADKSTSIEEIARHSTRCVILGDPGGGKSTLAMKFACDIASDGVSGLTARVPFFVVLRDYAESARGANRTSLVDYIEALCASPYGVNPPPDAVEYLLLNDNALVVFDGLDELLDTSLRRDVVQAVEGFAYRYPTTPIVVTSRRIGYEEAPLDPDLFPVAQLEEFSQGQVNRYAKLWFDLDEDQSSTERGRLATAFLRDSAFVADLRVNPLMLSLMCGIYATENYIPRNRPEVYEKCALLLFERWDKQRGISVSLPFEAHVYAAMRSLALHMYSQEQPQLKRHELVSYIREYLLQKRFDDADIAESAAEEFIDFCKGRAWVLTDVGHEKYGFTHRTFLEYFSASQLVRLNPNAESLFNILVGHLCVQEWDAVAQLAVQILGRTVEDGADEFLRITVEAASTVEEAHSINLLSFASRALQFIVPRPSVLASIVSSSVRLLSDTESSAGTRSRRRLGFEIRPAARPTLHLFGASGELRAALGRLIRDELQRSLGIDWRREDLLVFAFAPWVWGDMSVGESIRVDWDYWRRWARDNERLLSEHLALAHAKYYWLDLLRLSNGDIDLTQVLEQHGALALFEYHIAGYGPRPPIAYSLLLGSSEPWSLLSLLRWGRRLQSSRLIKQLEAALPDVPPPWLPYRRRYLVLSEIIDAAILSRRLPPAVALLLSAPLAELHVIGNLKLSSIGEHSKSAIATVLGARLGVSSTKEALDALEELEITGKAHELLRDWISGSISFVKHSSRRADGVPQKVTT